MKDFFISYNNRDEKWAQWIAWQLRQEKYQVVLQAWDFQAGGNFVLDMHKAATECARTLGVMSANSLTAPFVLQEWAAAMVKDPTGELRKFVPVRVAPCEPDGLLKAIVYIDLVGLPPKEARERLLARLKPGGPPAEEPEFPGEAGPGPSGAMQVPAEKGSAPEVFPGQTVPVFVCAAEVEADLRYLDELRRHLYQPQRRGELRLWHPRDIPAGAPRREEIDAHFQEAAIVLLLVTANLLSTEETVDLVERAMKRQREGRVRVVPVLAGAADLKGVSFEGLVKLPRSEKPVVKWSDRDEAWVEVVRELRGLLPKVAG
jgi:hypothetical protein